MDAADLTLIRDVADLTGGSPPDWTDADAPTLQSATDHDATYFIGVIGGKDVGKSSLVNALLGEPLADVSAHGEGTRRALAYAHRDDAAVVRDRLQADVPGQFDLVTHAIAAGRRRVLLDLPDIDSVWAGHLDLTRAVLRHLLFPIWVQSIEKYADAQPMRLLGKVAAGNAPGNFLFVLTKADVLAARHGGAAVDELKADFAERVTRACGLDAPPPVFAVDGRGGGADRFDLPALRQTALAVRAESAVAAARQLARQQQAKSMHQWLMQQRVDDRLAAAERLLAEAEAMVTARVAEPLVDRVTQSLADGAVRGGLVEPAVRSRLSYWPVVNVIDGVLGPVVAAFRGRGVALTATASGETDAARRVRGVFADLAQRDPLVLTLYAAAKLWENDAADRAAGALDARLEAAIDAHRRTLLADAGRPNVFVRLLAVPVTLGAALWFPLVQPVLELVLSGTVREFSRASALLVVRLLGAEYLIRSVGMLVIYFVALWMLLRWLGYRRVERALRHRTDVTHPAAAVLDWAQRLLDPIRQHATKLRGLSDRIAGVRRSAA